jgi:hypothetical protein
MHSFTITYTIKYVIDFAPNYAFNQYKEMYNLKTGRRKKKVSNNGTIGYIIDGKFYSLNQLRPHLIKPKKNNCPF